MPAAPDQAADALAVERLHASVKRVTDAVGAAARLAGRDPREVRLIAVSKTQPWHAVDAAAAAGQTAFGENTLQDAITKVVQAEGRNLEWHFLGHVQSNKAAAVATRFDWIHSVDSLRLAQRLSRAALEHARSVDVLVQVNMTREPARSGVRPERLAELVDSLQREDLSGVRLRGLMTIGPRNGDEADQRAVFAALRRLRDCIAEASGLTGFTELSMGMSGDYVSAIREGATLVRIGTAIFGRRAPIR